MYLKFLCIYSQTSVLLSRKTASDFSDSLTRLRSVDCNQSARLSAFVYGGFG